MGSGGHRNHLSKYMSDSHAHFSRKVESFHLLNIKSNYVTDFDKRDSSAHHQIVDSTGRNVDCLRRILLVIFRHADLTSYKIIGRGEGGFVVRGKTPFLGLTLARRVDSICDKVHWSLAGHVPAADSTARLRRTS